MYRGADVQDAMKLALIGFGNAGSKVVDAILSVDDRSLCQDAIAVNSATADLERPDLIASERRILIGQTDDRVKGHGVGADPDLGREITKQDLYELNRAVDDVPIYDIDAFLVVAGLGGGTGSGGAPVFAEALADTYREPVYGLAILPSADEGGRATYNAARALPTFADATENLLVFDNNAWRGAADTLGGGYERTNQEIAERVMTLLSAGSKESGAVAENVMDASDIRRTLEPGGVSSIAFARAEADGPGGLMDKFRSNGHSDADTAKKVSGLVRRAVQSRLTLPADPRSAERSLIVISGPPEEFSRKGLETARAWLEEETGSIEVLAGDNPQPNATELTATVLLSNVTDVPRVDDLQDVAMDAQENIEEKSRDRDERIDGLLHRDGLEPV